MMYVACSRTWSTVTLSFALEHLCCFASQLIFVLVHAFEHSSNLLAVMLVIAAIHMAHHRIPNAQVLHLQ